VRNDHARKESAWPETMMECTKARECVEMDLEEQHVVVTGTGLKWLSLFCTGVCLYLNDEISGFVTSNNLGNNPIPVHGKKLSSESTERERERETKISGISGCSFESMREHERKIFSVRLFFL
jgi:hypothetical protein